VLESWIDPCHLQIYNVSGDPTESFNSGAFNVNSEKAATPTTWEANDLNSACATSYTGGTVAATATNTLPITATQPTSTAVGSSPIGSNSTSCDSSTGKSQKSSSPSFGAGIGIGVAIGVIFGAATAFGWWLLNKRGNKASTAGFVEAQQSSADVYNNDQKNGAYNGHGLQNVAPSELGSDVRTAELPS
jgi:hypothetical protein